MSWSLGYPQVLGLFSVLEIVDPRVLEKSPDHRDDSDALAKARQPRRQHAEAANNDVDRHPCLVGAGQGLTHGAVFELVQLGDDACRPACLAVSELAVNESDEPLAHVDGRHQQLRPAST